MPKCVIYIFMRVAIFPSAAMELEAKQIEVLEQFCLLAKSARGRGLVDLIARATADPNLFAFGELLDVAQIKEVVFYPESRILFSSYDFEVSRHRVLWWKCKLSPKPIWVTSQIALLLTPLTLNFRLVHFPLPVYFNRSRLHPPQLAGSEHESSLSLLKLFAFGTWSDYKGERQHHCLQEKSLVASA